MKWQKSESKKNNIILSLPGNNIMLSPPGNHALENIFPMHDIYELCGELVNALWTLTWWHILIQSTSDPFFHTLTHPKGWRGFYVKTFFSCCFDDIVLYIHGSNAPLTEMNWKRAEIKQLPLFFFPSALSFCFPFHNHRCICLYGRWTLNGKNRLYIRTICVMRFLL